MWWCVNRTSQQDDDDDDDNDDDFMFYIPFNIILSHIKTTKEL